MTHIEEIYNRLADRRRAAKKGAVKLKPNISRNKYLSIFGYGALPHRPTKGLSGRPLETFGQKYLIFLEISILLA